MVDMFILLVQHGETIAILLLHFRGNPHHCMEAVEIIFNSTSLATGLTR
jgi:hypothetical protein